MLRERIAASPLSGNGKSATASSEGRVAIKRLALVLGAIALGPAALAAGVDSRAYSCGDLHALIAARGFVFIGNPDFQDFVVADPAICGGAQQLQLRSVPTIDSPECLVNYCVPAHDGRGRR